MKGFVFRRSNPAIFGVEVLEGRLKPKYHMMKGDGVVVGAISGIQDKGKSIDVAYKGNQVAVSIKEAVVGRSFSEGDILYSSPSYNDFKTLKSKYFDKLDDGEKEAFDEILKIKKAKDPSFIFL
jgi:translation initiation factor 5B